MPRARAAARSTTLVPVASTPMYFSRGRFWMVPAVSAALLVKRMSASAARRSSSVGGGRSKMAHGPRDWRSSQLRSPGFRVKPSRTTRFMTASSDLGQHGGFEEALELAPAGRVAEFAQGLGLDLADALACDFILPAALLQGAREAFVQAVAEFQDPALALGQAVEHLAQLAPEQVEAGDLARILGGLVFDVAAEMRFVRIAHRRLHGDGLLGHLQNGAHAFDGHFHVVGQLVGSGLAPQFLHELLLRAPEPIDDLDHVDRDADGAGLVGDAAGNGLANPPGGIG